MSSKKSSKEDYRLIKGLSKELIEKLERENPNIGKYRLPKTPRYDETPSLFSSLSKLFFMIVGIALFFYIVSLIVRADS